MYFSKTHLLQKSHLLFENSSTSKNSSTFRKLIYCKKFIYFSRTHLLQKTHLLFENSSTSKRSSTFRNFSAQKFHLVYHISNFSFFEYFLKIVFFFMNSFFAFAFKYFHIFVYFARLESLKTSSNLLTFEHVHF